MNKKIIGLIITAVVCIAFIIAGILIIRPNGNSREIIPEETSITDETIITTSTGSGNIIFETDIFSEKTTDASENENDPLSTMQTSETIGNNIYVEEDGMIPGGNFSWR